MLGELRSMSISLLGSVGLFSLLQEVFCNEDPTPSWLNLSKPLHGFLADFRWLANDVVVRQTRIAEVVLDTCPAKIGACDAAGLGMGGVHFVPTPNGAITPLLWQQRSPPWIQRQLVSFSNPDGMINNNDLEPAGSVVHYNALAIAADVRKQIACDVYDNTVVVLF